MQGQLESRILHLVFPGANGSTRDEFVDVLSNFYVLFRARHFQLMTLLFVAWVVCAHPDDLYEVILRQEIGKLTHVSLDSSSDISEVSNCVAQVLVLFLKLN